MERYAGVFIATGCGDTSFGDLHNPTMDEPHLTNASDVVLPLDCLYGMDVVVRERYARRFALPINGVSYMA